MAESFGLDVAAVILGLLIVIAAIGMRVATETITNDRPGTGFVIWGVGFLMLLGLCLISNVAPLIVALAVVFSGVFVVYEMRLWVWRERNQEVEFLWMMALAHRCGKPLAEEVRNYASEKHGQRRVILQRFASELENGVPIVACFPTQLLMESVRLGVMSALASPSPERALVQYAQDRTRDLAAEGNLAERSVVGYGIGVVLAVVMLVEFMMYWIIPKFKKIFDDFNVELPSVTRVMIFVSDRCVQYLPIGLVIAVPVGGYLALRWVRSGVRFGRADLIGVIADCLRRYSCRANSPQVLQGLAIGTRAGATMPAAIETMISNVRFPIPQRGLRQLLERVNSGRSIPEALRECQFINLGEASVLDAAERAGNLSAAMEAIAETLEQRRETRIAVCRELAVPLLVLAIGPLVLFYALAFFFPLIHVINALA